MKAPKPTRAQLVIKADNDKLMEHVKNFTSPWVIYILRHPLTYQVCYVGATSNIKQRRKSHTHSHIEKTLGPHYVAWRTSLAATGLMPIIEVISTAENKSIAIQKEAIWIERYLDVGTVLVNRYIPPVRPRPGFSTNRNHI